jgi:hypothetical protein
MKVLRLREPVARICLQLTSQPPDKQALFKGTLVLEDAKKLSDMRVENDDVLALTFLQDGERELVTSEVTRRCVVNRSMWQLQNVFSRRSCHLA